MIAGALEIALMANLKRLTRDLRAVKRMVRGADERRDVLNELICWLDSRGVASVVCPWGRPDVAQGKTIRKLVEEFRDSPNASKPIAGKKR